jgi:haloalkane dehalogenase
MKSATQYPNWLDRNAYPFEGKYIQVDGGNMHYVDEGEGPPVVMVHGTPTWSFLYRHMIKNLREDYRCIAMDHIGFGMSDKPESWAYAPEAHGHNLHLLMDALHLDDISLIVHDFGGPIGLSYAIAHPEKIRRIAMCNTWLWSLDEDDTVAKAAKIASGPIGKFLYRYFNFSARMLIKQGFRDSEKLTKEIHYQYIQPFDSRAKRSGTIGFAEALLGSGEWYESLWAKRGRLKGKPVQFLWGVHDGFLQSHMLEKWKSAFPEASVEELEAGHFVQDEQPDKVNQVLRDFLQ